jgi:hypothetical protein
MPWFLFKENKDLYSLFREKKWPSYFSRRLCRETESEQGTYKMQARPYENVVGNALPLSGTSMPLNFSYKPLACDRPRHVGILIGRRRRSPPGGAR